LDNTKDFVFSVSAAMKNRKDLSVGALSENTAKTVSASSGVEPEC